MWYNDNPKFFRKERDTINISQPNLHFRKDANKMLLVGKLEFYRTYDEYPDKPINDVYEIEIEFPSDYPESAPKTKEIGGRILKSYHTNPDMSLCLETEYEVFKRFIPKKF